MSLIELRDVTKSFGDNKVLKGVNLEIEEGESLIILGRSGIGKSVTLLIITGLMPPDSGAVFIDGQDITKLSEIEMIALRRRFSYVFQSGALFDSLSVYENVAFPFAEDRHISDEAAEKKVFSILQLLGLEKIADLMPDEISSGMKKRVAIARAIAADPRAILYDEPTTGVDTITGKLISRLIRKLNKDLGVTTVVVTHDLKCAQFVADKVAFLHDGRIYFHDTFDAFLKSELKELLRFKRSLPHMMKYIGAE
ncbi:MAG: ATP-binding cassette domain-containing protein [Acidobacteria bacterium]|nr:ATP-binding cassette domain-containing protein [Acidobacteriota bacterium]